MNAILIVARFEYIRQVIKRRFLWATLSLPIMIVLIVGTGFGAAWFSTPKKPIGYVDVSGHLQPEDFEQRDTPAFLRVRFQPFPDEASARQALEEDRITAYVLLPTDYPREIKVQLVYYRYPGNMVESALEDALRHSLLRETSSEQRALLAQLSESGIHWRFRTLGKAGERDQRQLGVQLAPIFGAFTLLLLTFIASGYLLGAVVDEKVNRTAEVLVSSVSSNQLLAGKLLGITALALTQLLVWAAFVVGGWLVLRTRYTWMREITFSWSDLLLPLLIVLPAYLMLAGVLATLGAMVTEPSEAQQWTSLFTLPMIIPLYLVFLLLPHPNSPLAVGLTLFPLTAPLTLIIRRAAGEVPLWQMLLSQALAWGTGIGAVWLSGYVFRLGMLRYGKRLRFREILQRGGAA